MYKSMIAVTGALLAALALSACSRSQANSPDQAITSTVQQNLNTDPALQGAKLTASTQNGVVTLTGTVASEAARMEAAKDAQVPGATQINNQIATMAPAQVVAPAPAPPAASAAMTPSSAPQNRPARQNRTVQQSRPAANAPAPQLSAAAPVQVATGTPLAVRLNRGLSSATASAGQTFSAIVATPVLVNGQIAVPQGARVTGSVVAADSAGHFRGQSRLVLTLDQLSYGGQTYSLRTQQYVQLASSRGRRTAEAVGGGAALGAIIGAIAGHGKGAAIGALTGAGAGTAAQALTGPAEVVLPAETVITFDLSRSVQVLPQAAAN